ncbi:MAG TPA: ATP-dependent DNA helicase RecQ [Bryobacteraceae bacterium]|nr:ATP-dependent DNA helicase RecQ [Bryobacteraceae bacterium]
MPSSLPAEALTRILSETFGFAEFRAGQDAVCSAVCTGRDALVVMPTGSGKSLCYQLPAIALGGTALVISPLIALMEDQVAKLRERGLHAERIHSGRPREASRAAAMDYRDGKLQFLFLAPERFSVPGVTAFLARRKPCLVAIDEAHCISQWGHDFRPDYRMLSQHLPAFRPAPVIALTATATRVVQSDIVQQLALENPLRSIQGFRRKNIAIEVVEIPPAARRDSVLEILRSADRRPAIIYVPTRNDAEELAVDLNRHFRADAYHAGLNADHRQRVQREFLSGEREVIVATIAFGMGIDKPDVRTVIHTALPGSTEAYYQEIGRAGRDGLPSRAILMHSYADRHRHDFFFDRDYPEPDVVAEIFNALRRDRAISKEQLQKQSRLDPAIFDTALEKLWIHGGAIIDPEENVQRGTAEWRDSYIGQSRQRAVQLEQMLRYAAADQCRMSALVRYFGDHTDAQTHCGNCDFCAPQTCVAQQFRAASIREEKTAHRVLKALQGGLARSSGKLHAELCPHGELDRDPFEELLGAMARAGLIFLREAVFEKDGKQIPYRTAQLTREGEILEPDEPLALELREKPERHAGKKRAYAPRAETKPNEIDAADQPLFDALRAWRLAEAKAKNLPAFRIASDALLRSLTEDRPLSEDDLLMIRGAGPGFVKHYGNAILKVIASYETARVSENP